MLTETNRASLLRFGLQLLTFESTQSVYLVFTKRQQNIKVNKYPTRCNYTEFILSVNCSTCFGWFLHQSSGAKIPVSTASGTSQPWLLPAYFFVPEGCVCSIAFSFGVFKLIYFFCLFDMNEFYVHGTVHRNSVSINVQQDATTHNLFYL